MFLLLIGPCPWSEAGEAYDLGQGQQMVWGRESLWSGAGKAYGLGQGKRMKAYGLGQGKLMAWGRESV